MSSTETRLQQLEQLCLHLQTQLINKDSNGPTDVALVNPSHLSASHVSAPSSRLQPPQPQRYVGSVGSRQNIPQPQAPHHRRLGSDPYIDSIFAPSTSAAANAVGHQKQPTNASNFNYAAAATSHKFVSQQGQVVEGGNPQNHRQQRQMLVKTINNNNMNNTSSQSSSGASTTGAMAQLSSVVHSTASDKILISELRSQIGELERKKIDLQNSEHNQMKQLEKLQKLHEKNLWELEANWKEKWVAEKKKVNKLTDYVQEVEKEYQSLEGLFQVEKFRNRAVVGEMNVVHQRAIDRLERRIISMQKEGGEKKRREKKEEGEYNNEGYEVESANSDKNLEGDDNDMQPSARKYKRIEPVDQKNKKSSKAVGVGGKRAPTPPSVQESLPGNVKRSATTGNGIVKTEASTQSNMPTYSSYSTAGFKKNSASSTLQQQELQYSSVSYPHPQNQNKNNNNNTSFSLVPTSGQSTSLQRQRGGSRGGSANEKLGAASLMRGQKQHPQQLAPTSARTSPSPTHPFRGSDGQRRFTFSCINADEKQKVAEAINSLQQGASVMECFADAPPPETITHIVVVNRPCSVKALSALVAGKWVVQPEYIYKSLEMGFWLDELEFGCLRCWPLPLQQRWVCIRATSPRVRQKLEEVVLYGGGENVKPGADTTSSGKDVLTFYGGDDLLNFCYGAEY